MRFKYIILAFFLFLIPATVFAAPPEQALTTSADGGTFDVTNQSLRIQNIAPEYAQYSLSSNILSAGALTEGSSDSTTVIEGLLYTKKSLLISFTAPVTGIDSLYVEMRGHTGNTYATSMYMGTWKLTKDSRINGEAPYLGWVIDLPDKYAPYYDFLLYLPTGGGLNANMTGVTVSLLQHP